MKKVTWRGLSFKSVNECARALDHRPSTLRSHLSKYKTLEYITPNKNSDHYNVALQHDNWSYVAQAVKDYGVKAVARAFSLYPQSIRQRRKNGTLWQLGFPRPPAVTGDPTIVLNADELEDKLLNPPRRPYVYWLRWSKTGVKYVGSRTAQYCEPSDLLQSYFTSSPYVSEYIENHGLPDHRITREFPTPESALFAEGMCLCLISANDKIFSQYLNTVKWVDPNNIWTVEGRRTNHMAWERDKYC